MLFGQKRNLIEFEGIWISNVNLYEFWSTISYWEGFSVVRSSLLFKKIG